MHDDDLMIIDGNEDGSDGLVGVIMIMMVISDDK